MINYIFSIFVCPVMFTLITLTKEKYSLECCLLNIGIEIIGIDPLVYIRTFFLNEQLKHINCHIETLMHKPSYIYCFILLA